MFVPALYPITGCDTMSHKFNVEKFHVFFLKISVYKNPSSHTLIKMLEVNVTFAENLSKSQRIFVEAIIYNGKLNENSLSKKCVYIKIVNKNHQCYFHQIQIHLLTN